MTRLQRMWYVLYTPLRGGDRSLRALTARLRGLKLSCRNHDAPVTRGWHVWSAPDVAYCRADRCDLHPLVVMHKLDLDIDADDAICAEPVGLELHAAQRQLACLVHQLRVFFEFALEIAFEAHEPVAYCAHGVDAVANNQTHWLEALVNDEPELLSAQIGGECAPPVPRSYVHCIAWFAHKMCLAFFS